MRTRVENSVPPTALPGKSDAAESTTATQPTLTPPPPQPENDPIRWVFMGKDRAPDTTRLTRCTAVSRPPSYKEKHHQALRREYHTPRGFPAQSRVSGTTARPDVLRNW
ncbi:hypothetical protein H920_09307 [Fukomys damarensis]|uniref:Uncharacterized protein n=1 Tax=Fukomys damarensis TaxID=885580 RepID=A0A091DAX8_FUKDA|nr:hypothetical protein H920_09307 [Fukomys damarensis]